MNTVSTKAPEAIASDMKAYFRTRRRKGQVLIVAKKGAPGTMRQTIRQRSSKIMREGGHGRKTKAVKNRLAMLAEKAINPSVIKEVRKAKDCLNMSLTEAWDAFAE